MCWTICSVAAAAILTKTIRCGRCTDPDPFRHQGSQHDFPPHDTHLPVERLQSFFVYKTTSRASCSAGANIRLGETLDREWRRAQRTRSTFSLLFVDIDRFKAYNDAYGHQAGDDALAAVARCIGNNIRRPGDSAARYGGEEFIVVLPETPTEGARHIAEKIRSAIVNLAIEHAGSEFGRVTASIGLATWSPQLDCDISTVIRVADEALYNAKATGRNKVALSPNL